MLKTEDLHVSYGGIRALRGVNINIPQGEIVAILGANGAGKTTLLRTISGLVKSEQGKVIYLDNNITKAPVEKIVKNGILHVPEGRQIFEDLSVFENLKIGAFSTEKKEMKFQNLDSDVQKLVIQRLKQLSIKDNPTVILNKQEAFMQNLSFVYRLFPVLKERKSQIATTLSGGEMQMLAIGRALMGSPKLLILDEPSLGLAPLIIKSIFETITMLKEQGLSILIVEQNALQTLKIADYAYVLQIGKVVKEGKAKDLIKDHSLIEAYLG
ncbi:ABC transporter ATP-binding protein [Hujiaoplasma nucleasis]|uniref:ABC transporter ATP-binding protein n=1 Tax=Hujiaoplasma nucleasis TaxID=2725268 RepID=UPI0035E3E04D